MSGEVGREADRSSRARMYSDTRTVAFAVAFALLVCALAFTFSTSVVAQEGDSTPPGLGNATKGNLTTIDVTITDDNDVDETSISASDFSLSTGAIRDLSVNETGTDSHVEIRLSDIVAANNITVSIAEGGSIRDAAGNEFASGSAVVTGMDGYRPQLKTFRVTRLNETRARVLIVSSAPLSELYVGVGGPGSDTLTMANFTKMDSAAQFEIPYEANVTFDQDGEYDLLVGTMIDESGVESRYNVEKTVLVDRTRPTASISAPASTDVGEPVTLNAAGSNDEFGIAGYNWSIDGNATGSKSTIEHTFRTPGYHEITLTVRDRRNNSDSTTFPILVDSKVTKTGVSIDATDATDATSATEVSATVGPNRSVGRVLIARNGSLVSTEDVRIDSLTVDVPVNTTANLGFSTAANVSTWFDTANTTAFAGFEVAHDRSLSTATVRFSVNRSRLDATGIAPDGVTLYREVDGWRSVYTTKIDESQGWVTYEATAAGLSRFVVGASGGATETNASEGADGSTNATNEDAVAGGNANAAANAGAPSILVTSSTVLTETIDPGDRAIFRAVAHNDGNATGSYEVGLVVNNSVLTTTNVTVPAGENRTVTFVERIDTGGSVVVNGTLAGTISVGGNGSAAAATSGGGLPIPDPLALWPGGLFGRLLGAVFWFVVILYGVLKSLAIYLGY